MADTATSNLPGIIREEWLPTASRMENAQAVRSVVETLDAGVFSEAARLVDQMMMNGRLRAMLETRLSALTGAEQRWRERRNNRDARRAKRDIEEDWPRMASTPTRWQNQVWGLLLGLGLGVIDWHTDPMTLRQIPRFRAFAPYGVYFRQDLLEYEVLVYGGQIHRVPSPAFQTGRAPMDSPWIVHEPFGTYSYRWGYSRAAWYSWLGHNFGQRDRFRMSEKVGTGIALADVPVSASKEAAKEFRDDVRAVRSGGVLMCQEYEDGTKFNLRPFEWNAQNTAGVVDDATASAAADLTILFLGHATLAESDGGASHDLARAGENISGDRTNRDAEAETSTFEDQLVGRYAEANYGDPGLAPIREVVTDPPARDAARALMLQQMAGALDALSKHGVDTKALCEEMRLPMALRGTTQAQVPAEPSAPPDPKETP